MTLKQIATRALKRLQLDLTFYLKKAGNKDIFEVSPKEIQHPIFLRKNTSDEPAYYQIFHHKEYDMPLDFVPATIIDCGANIGLTTVFFKNKYPGATIVAVEPEASNFKMLEKNTDKYKDVHCLQYGIWNKTTNLKIINTNDTHWGFTTEETDQEGADIIKSISIDKIMELYHLDSIDILKIDIEASEKELFEKNYEKWLPKVKVIFIELHDEIKEGCSRSFFKALVNYDFTMDHRGELLICKMK